jgi:hypothetical protein
VIKGLTKLTRIVQAWLAFAQKFMPVNPEDQFWLPLEKDVVNSKPVDPSDVGCEPVTLQEWVSLPPAVESTTGAVTVPPVPQASLAQTPP